VFEHPDVLSPDEVEVSVLSSLLCYTFLCPLDIFASFEMLIVV
jgi:hypothetical protein